MSKQNAKKPCGKTKPRDSFVGFWSLIAQRLGENRLRIRANAPDIEHFFASNSDHGDFLREIIITSYIECDCVCIDDLINVNAVLDVMGEAAYELQIRQEDDLLDIELLEEISYHIQQDYPHHIVMPNPSALTQEISQQARSSIHSLSDLRIRRANAKL
jgi:hypothetical protein